MASASARARAGRPPHPRADLSDVHVILVEARLKAVVRLGSLHAGGSLHVHRRLLDSLPPPAGMHRWLLACACALLSSFREAPPYLAPPFLCWQHLQHLLPYRKKKEIVEPHEPTKHRPWFVEDLPLRITST